MRSRRIWWRFVSALSLGAAAVGSWAAETETPAPLPAALSLPPVTLSERAWTSGLAPFYHGRTNATVRQWAVPPLFSRTVSLDLEREEIDVLYPLLTYDRYGEEKRFQILQALTLSGGQTQTNTTRQRFSLVPFYFQQRSEVPEENYRALVPVYGTIKGRFLRDEIQFILFPLYSKTRKRDVVTRNYLYPFFHLRTGEELRGWQAWPIAGYEVKGVTERVDGFGDRFVKGGHRKLSVAWPFFFDYTTGIGTDNPKRQQALVPLYYSERSAERDYTSVIGPFFSRTHDRKEGYREWSAPWPLVTRATGPGKEAFRIWPLFSRARSATQRSDTYLGPLWKYQRLDRTVLERERHRMLYFLFSDIRERNKETGETRRRTDLWPLFTYRRELDQSTRLQVLAPLEPILAGNKSVERNFSPLWSIYRRERDDARGFAKTAVLWNLYRREASPDVTRSWHFFGLVASERHDDATSWRVGPLRFGGGETAE